MTSAFSHLMLHDRTGFLGVTLRKILGDWDVNTVIIVLSTMHIVTLVSQVLIDPETNVFESLQCHRLAYALTGVQGPLKSPQSSLQEPAFVTRMWIERIILGAKIWLCLIGISLAITQRIPPTHLPAGTSAWSAGQGIGQCMWLSEVRGCRYVHQFHNNMPSI